TNTGTITLNGGSGTITTQATLAIASAAPSVMTGDLNLYGHALVEFATGSIAGIANSATLHIAGTNAFVADTGATTSNSALSGLANNAGLLELDSGATIHTAGDFINNGT